VILAQLEFDLPLIIWLWLIIPALGVVIWLVVFVVSLFGWWREGRKDGRGFAVIVPAHKQAEEQD
jgi:hypothetical protein